MRKFYFIGLIILVLVLIGLAWADQVTLTTYYPAPYGVYKEFKTTDNTYLATDSGNVGIGTANPLYKLDVAGDINTSGDVYKSGIPYVNPDYVFEPGYELMPLGELRDFVAKSKHLPGMPSTKEVKEKGVKIFEQNRLILEKLEEAYLYILKLSEKVEDQQTEIVALQAQLRETKE